MFENSALIMILNVAGAVALLLWAVRQIRVGVERAFAHKLRKWLRQSTKNRPLSAMTGGATAMLLQSSTAVAMLVAGFVTAGTLGTTAGIAIMLGADVGSAVVAKILVTRWTFIMPLLFLVGVTFFLNKGPSGRTRQIGRILIGLGLVFLSLDLMREATSQIADNQQMSAALQSLGSDLPIAFIIGGILAWGMHSSVAAILLFVTLASQSALTPIAAAIMVLGANTGGALIAVILTLNADVKVRRVTTANLIIRGFGAIVVAVLLTKQQDLLSYLGTEIVGQIILLHLIFNSAICVASLPFVSQIEKLTKLLHTEQTKEKDGPGPTTALDASALAHPDRALALARREVLRMGETLEGMLRVAGALLKTWDESKAKWLAENNAFISTRHHDLKMYLAKLAKHSDDDLLDTTAMDLANIANGLELASDIIAQNLCKLAKRLHDDGLHFSEPGQRDIEDFHDRVLANVQLSLDVLMTREIDIARSLISEKDMLRDAEQNLQIKHLARLRDGMPESIETSAIHQETIRALKQINSSFSVIGALVLERSGGILSSRLV